MFTIQKWSQALIKMGVLFSVALLSMCIAACDEKEDRSNVLVVATSADNPPFVYFSTTGQNREIVGFEMDLVQELAKAMGKKLEVQDIDFSSIIPAIQAKRADLGIAAFSVTEERLKNVDFSHPYYEVSTVLITPEESNFMAQSDFQSQKIGVLLGSYQEAQAKELAAQKAGLTVQSMNRYPDLFQELQNGRVQAILIEETTGKAFLKNYAGHHWKLEKADLPGSHYAIVLPKGSKLAVPLNEALDKLKADGTVAALKKKWFEK